MPRELMGPPAANGAAGAPIMGERLAPVPEGPHIELEGGRKVPLTESESLRLELLATQGQLFDSKIQILTRAKQEASEKGNTIIAGAIERDQKQQAAALAAAARSDAGEPTAAPAVEQQDQAPPDPVGGASPADGPN